MQSSRLKSQQPRKQHILVSYDTSLQTKIKTVYSSIQRQYASVYIVTPQNSPKFQNYKPNVLLTKRPIKFIHLQPFFKQKQQILQKQEQKQEQIECDKSKQLNQQITCKNTLDVQVEMQKKQYKLFEKFNISYYSNWLHYCDGSCSKTYLDNYFPTVQIIQIKQSQQQKQMLAKATKLMHLDFIWLGVGSRIGSSVNEFYSSIRQFQDFSNYEVNFLSSFLSVLDNQLSKQPTLLENGPNPQLSIQFYQQIFDRCSEQLKLSQKIAKIQPQIQQLINEKYNMHVLVSQLTYHNYFKLLKTRNYFKLIWIQQSALKRYINFMRFIKQEQEQEQLESKQQLNDQPVKVQQNDKINQQVNISHQTESANLSKTQQSILKYENIYKWLKKSINNFLMFDDYFYEKYQQKVQFSCDFVMNVGTIKQDYRVLIQKNYKQIFRKFRPDFDEYFISICQMLKIRAGCIKQAVGSIIVKNKRILSTGYNGTPRDSINCYNGGCRVCNDSSKINTTVLSCNCIHAEYSCIIQAGIEHTPGCILYTTQLPCLWCTKVICQAKLSKVVYVQNQCRALQYDNQDRVFDIFKISGIQLKKFKWGQKKYSKV